MKAEPHPSEILEAITVFAENVDIRLEKLEKLHGRFDKLEGRFDKLEGRVGNIESQMVTKSYLDDKLADMKGDMVSMLRKEDQKVNRLVGVLAEKTVLSKAEAKDVLSFRPFP